MFTEVVGGVFSIFIIKYTSTFHIRECLEILMNNVQSGLRFHCVSKNNFDHEVKHLFFFKLISYRNYMESLYH